MRKRVIVLSVCFALVATVFGSGVAIADPSSSLSPKPAAGLLNESDAMRQAKESGKPVEVSALSDERTLVTADPGTGLFSAQLTAGVARVRDAKGGWREPSTKLVQGEDGLWRPEATVAQIVVSNGGAREPLVSLADGEARVSLGWPEKLPEPVVEGAGICRVRPERTRAALRRSGKSADHRALAGLNKQVVSLVTMGFISSLEIAFRRS
ncbi:MAG: hypothetical protein QM695_08890 [Micropruina sp.]